MQRWELYLTGDVCTHFHVQVLLPESRGVH